jgi:hypothetical protein
MFELFKFKGLIDEVMIQTQQYTSPKILPIPFNKQLSLKYGDLIKIKGFILNGCDIQKITNEHLEICFGSSYFKVPFSFLIKSSKNGAIYFNRNDKTRCFIDFPHDYFFNHKIPIFQMEYSDVSVKLTNETLDYNVEIVLDTHFLDAKEKSEINSIAKSIQHNIKNVEHFKIPFVECESNLHVYKTDISVDFLNQGLFIVKNDDKEIQNITIVLNNSLTVLNYDVDLLNIYGEDVGGLTYYGFNVGEKYDSNNAVGCINLSIFDTVTVIITMKHLKDKNQDNYLNIYMPYWNILMYKQGLVGLTFLK